MKWEEYKRIEELLEELRDIGNQALDELRKLNATHEGAMRLRWGKPSTNVDAAALQQNAQHAQGEISMAGSAGKMSESQTILCNEVEVDGAGNPVTVDPKNALWAVADPTVATVVTNDGSDPKKPAGSGTFTPVKPVAPATDPRTSAVSCTDTATGVVGVGTLEIDASGSMTLSFDAPA